MDPRAALAAFDQQIRRAAAGPDEPGSVTERDVQVIRHVPDGDGWAGVTWSGLNPDGSDADAVIAAEIRRFAGVSVPWEWKHYSYDQPADLAERLRAAGFVPEPAETLLVAEIAELDLDPGPPPGVRLSDVDHPDQVAAVVAVHDAVFGGDHAGIGRLLLAGLAEPVRRTRAVVAIADGRPVSSGRLELHHGTEFAGLWGGGTLPAWRRRGLFRALVAHRAALAAAHGFRYLQVDATDDSRPILRRLGFAELATTTPFIGPPGR